MVAGDIIEFGNIKWRVLEVLEDRILVLAEEILMLRDYHNKACEVTWKNCELRKYLNNDFYNSFSEEDKEEILETVIKNPGNPWYKVEDGEDTLDKIFLLSMEEVVKKYFGDSSRLLDNPANNQRYWFQKKDENNIRRRAIYRNSIWWWWTRTPGKNKKYTVYIHGDGNIGIQGNGVSKRDTNIIHLYANDNRGGVRPALWIKNQKRRERYE